MSDTVASALFETKEGQRSPVVPGERNGRWRNVSATSYHLKRKGKHMLVVALPWVKVTGSMSGNYSCEAEWAVLETRVRLERGAPTVRHLKLVSASLESRVILTSGHVSSRTGTHR